MKHTEDLSDELLARYLSGCATPDEEAQVQDYAAAGDEQATDLLAMAEGIRLQRKMEAGRRRRPASRPLYRVAALLVLLLAVGAGYLFWGSSPKGNGTPTEPVTAEAAVTDTTIPLPVRVAPAQADTLQRIQRHPNYRMERREHITAAQGTLHYADSTANAPADTTKHCLKSITL